MNRARSNQTASDIKCLIITFSEDGSIIAYEKEKLKNIRLRNHARVTDYLQDYVGFILRKILVTEPGETVRCYVYNSKYINLDHVRHIHDINYYVIKNLDEI
jgi:hypothetical protein